MGVVKPKYKVKFEVTSLNVKKRLGDDFININTHFIGPDHTATESMFVPLKKVPALIKQLQKTIK